MYTSKCQPLAMDFGQGFILSTFVNLCQRTFSHRNVYISRYQVLSPMSIAKQVPPIFFICPGVKKDHPYRTVYLSIYYQSNMHDNLGEETNVATILCNFCGISLLCLEALCKQKIVKYAYNPPNLSLFYPLLGDYNEIFSNL